jgi:glycosyltransferase involved in cell wall biosynthesis
MKPLLSIWIVGRDGNSFLADCIESCRRLSTDIIYVDTGSEDGSREEAERLGVRAFTASQPSQECLEEMAAACATPWALFLRPDEILRISPDFRIEKALSDAGTRGFSIVVEERVRPEELEPCRWTRAVEGFAKTPPPPPIPVIEVRLVRKSFFAGLLRFMTSRSPGYAFPFESNVLGALRILSHPETAEPEASAEQRRALQLKLLNGELSCDPAADDHLDEFGDSFLIFSVLTREDLLRYHRGVEQGLGNERMYLTMLQYLSRFGRFQEAKEFFETWERSWGFFDTCEPYRAAGIIYLNLLEVDPAIACFRKYLETPLPAYREEVLSFLAKCLLLKGNREDLVALLAPLVERKNDPFDARILRIVQSPHWRPAKLSACLIARDEETTLPRALQSLSGIADEIILVDTGSVDGTREIAARFGCRVFETPWQNDFSRARNAGIHEATGDYVLVMDTDEFLDPRERLKLALFKQLLPPDRHIAFRTLIETEEPEEEMLVMLRLPQQSQKDHPVRVFPAGRDVFFEGPAFETVERSLERLGIAVVWNDLFKLSHARADRTSRERRKRRAVEGAFAFIDVFDIAWKGFAYFLAIGDLKAALPWLEKMKPTDERLTARIISLYAIHGVEGLESYLERAQVRFPSSPELAVAAADYRASARRFSDVILLLKTFVDTPGAITDRTLKARSLFLYGLALLEQEDLDQGIRCIADARDADPWNTRYKAGGIYAMARARHWDGVIRALDDVLRDENITISTALDDLSDLGMALLETSRHFQETGRRDEADLLQRAVEGMIGTVAETARKPDPLPPGRAN